VNRTYSNAFSSFFAALRCRHPPPFIFITLHPS
jgi:hypothetical protein